MWEGKIYLTAPPENVLPEPQGQHQWSSDDEHTRTRYKSCKSNLYTKSKQESDNSKRRTTDTTYERWEQNRFKNKLRTRCSLQHIGNPTELQI